MGDGWLLELSIQLVVKEQYATANEVFPLWIRFVFFPQQSRQWLQIHQLDRLKENTYQNRSFYAYHLRFVSYSTIYNKAVVCYPHVYNKPSSSIPLSTTGPCLYIYYLRQTRRGSICLGRQRYWQSLYLALGGGQECQ